MADNAEYPAIVSASISGPYSAALDQAVQTLVEVYGIPVVVSAGNECAVPQTMIEHESNRSALCWDPTAGC